MKTNERFSEPLVAVILKALSILSIVGAVICYVGMFQHDVKPDSSILAITQGAMEVAGWQMKAVTFTASAISLWWMGEIIALLAKIASNGSGQAALAQVTRNTKLRPTATHPSRADDDDEVPKYSL